MHFLRKFSLRKKLGRSLSNIDNVGLSGSSITQIVAAVFIHNELWLGGATTIIIIVYMRTWWWGLRGRSKQIYRDADCIEANSQFSFFRKEEEIYKEAESGWVRVESDSIRNQWRWWWRAGRLATLLDAVTYRSAVGVEHSASQALPALSRLLRWWYYMAWLRGGGGFEEKKKKRTEHFLTRPNDDGSITYTARRRRRTPRLFFFFFGGEAGLGH